MKTDERSPSASDVPGSAWSPFRHTIFTVLWVATVVSNIGSWMQSAAAGWLMTTPQPGTTQRGPCPGGNDPAHVPIHPPAGALADIVDRRRLLIVVQIAAVAVATLFAIFI